jgi:hypothetical protein
MEPSPKPVLAVLDLRTMDVSREEMLGVVDGLTAALFAESSFTVIDRSARDALLGELEFSLGAAGDRASQKTLGLQLSADVVVGGSVSRYENGKYALSLRMLDTASAEVIGVSEDIYDGLPDMLGALGRQADTLVSSVRPAKAAQLRLAGKAPGPSSAVSAKKGGGDDGFAPAVPRSWFPFQLSIWAPMQLVPAKTAIDGIRITMFYGDNVEVAGIDVGLINRVSGKMIGLQAGLIGYAGELTYIQLNAILNSATVVRGAQIGLVNVADKCSGMQIGLVNVAGLLRGVQLGLVNVIRFGEGSRFMPGINFSL